MGTILRLLTLLLTIRSSIVSAQECVVESKGCARAGSPFCRQAGSYDGQRSTTVSGKQCQAWSAQAPHKHEYGHVGDHNFCRNVEGDKAPWCYTMDNITRYEFCFPDCKECVDESKDCAHMGSLSCNMLTSYLGTKNTTANGKACQKWSSQEPHLHRFSSVGDHNYCRSADGMLGPWCFTVDKDIRWGYCFNDCSGCKCPEKVVFGPEEDFGEILSPRKISQYCNDLDCEWTIQHSVQGQGVMLQFRDKFFVGGDSRDWLDLYYKRLASDDAFKVESAWEKVEQSALQECLPPTA